MSKIRSRILSGRPKKPTSAHPRAVRACFSPQPFLAGKWKDSRNIYAKAGLSPLLDRSSKVGTINAKTNIKSIDSMLIQKRNKSKCKSKRRELNNYRTVCNSPMSREQLERHQNVQVFSSNKYNSLTEYQTTVRESFYTGYYDTIS